MLRYLSYLAFGVSLTVAALSAQAAEKATRPNIVLLMADDQGWGEVGYYGHPNVKTPVLDQMAAEGLRFDRCYSAAPNCTPTRAAVMTGRHANRSGAFSPNWSTRPEEITIAEVLKPAGYRTGHYGKWHIGAVKAASPVNPAKQGFDDYLSHDNFFELDPPLSRNGADPKIYKGESSEIIVDAASEFVRQVHQEGKPFFVVIWFGSPHGPYRGLPEDVALYADVKADELKHRYAEITAMDRAIGKFRKLLRELNVAENTLVWYKSDNGIPPDAAQKGSFNGGWRGAKGDTYEGGLRVPAIVEWPAVVTKPRVTNVACVSSDIFPTLLDILGLQSLDPSRPIDGISLKPLIVDGSMESRPQPIGFWKYPSGGERENGRWMPEELTRGTTPTTRNPAIDFLNFRHPKPTIDNFAGDAAWTDNRYKLVVFPGGGSGKAKKKGGSGARVELYDLQKDPQEKQDIAALHPEIVKRMQSELEDWQRSVEKSLSGADY